METGGTIFVRTPTSRQSLRDFAPQMFCWFGISKLKDDVSGSWKADEHFVVGSAVGISVEIRENDRKELGKYSFVVFLSLQGTSTAADYLVQHAHTLAWRLSREGYCCFVPKEWVTIRSDEDGIIYSA